MGQGVKLFGGKVTVSAEPFFWLMAGLFGVSLGRGSARETVMWTAVIGFSVLAHELGHAAVCLAWGKGADIVLHGFGGATRPRDGSRFGTWRTAALDLAGCAAGFGLAAAALESSTATISLIFFHSSISPYAYSINHTTV